VLSGADSASQIENSRLRHLLKYSEGSFYLHGCRIKDSPDEHLREGELSLLSKKAPMEKPNDFSNFDDPGEPEERLADNMGPSAVVL